jgi:transcriptional regulator with XRE-family HTH domain
MNSATFKIIRQFLGITADEVAKACGVTLRSARRWESSHTPPDDAVQWLQSKWYAMDAKVSSIIEAIDATEDAAGQKHIHLTAYRTDDSAEGALPSGVSKEQHAAILGVVQFLTMHDDQVHITIDFADVGE